MAYRPLPLGDGVSDVLLALAWDAIWVEPDVFRAAAMHQEDEGYEHSRDEDRIYQIALPPAILGNEPRAPGCEEERPHTSSGQSETGGKPAPAVKPPGHQRHMRDKAQGREAGTDNDPIVEVKLPQRSHAATEEKPDSQEHRGHRKHPTRAPPVKGGPNPRATAA